MNTSGMGRALAHLARAELRGAWEQHPFALPFLTWMTAWAIAPERRLEAFLQRVGTAREVLPAFACAGLAAWWFAARVL